jgi:hypothetical protein
VATGLAMTGKGDAGWPAVGGGQERRNTREKGDGFRSLVEKGSRDRVQGVQKLNSGLSPEWTRRGERGFEVAGIFI